MRSGTASILPFVLIYLHNVQGIGLGTAGLDPRDERVRQHRRRPGRRHAGRPPRRTAGACARARLPRGRLRRLRRSSTAPGRASLVAAVTGIGNGLFWPAQSTLITSCSPAGPPPRHVRDAAGRDEPRDRARRTRGRADRDDRRARHVRRALPRSTGRRSSCTSACSLPSSPSRRSTSPAARRPGGSYGRSSAIARSWASSRSTRSSSSPACRGSSCCRSREERGRRDGDEIGIDLLREHRGDRARAAAVTKLSEGHRRMRMLAMLGVLWAGCWVLVPLAGVWVTGVAAAVLLAASWRRSGSASASTAPCRDRSSPTSPSHG